MTTDRVRQLRANMTDAEEHLWRILRMRQLGGHRFRRQFQIGPFIADFACPQLRLVIEVDGGQHADSASDALRELWLQSEGWKVVRFWNNEVLAILRASMHGWRASSLGCPSSLTDPPPPNPPPSRGRARNPEAT